MQRRRRMQSKSPSHPVADLARQDELEETSGPGWALHQQGLMGNQAVAALVAAGVQGEQEVSGGAGGDADGGGLVSQPPGAPGGLGPGVAPSLGEVAAGANRPVPGHAAVGDAVGADLGGVRAVLGGPEATAALDGAGARAATLGGQIVFRDAQPDPSLVAHELVHAIQQGQGSASEQVRGGRGAEQEAHDLSDAAAAGRHVELGHAAPADEPQYDLLTDAEAVLSGIGRDVVLGAKDTYHDLAEASGLESADDANAARLQAFRDHGMFGPRDLVPPTNLGGFAASFDPAGMVLGIRVSGGVDFTDGLVLDETTGTITANTADLNQAAADGMNLPDLDSKKKFVADFKWTDKATWLGNLQSRVEGAWEAGYTFQCTRPGWDSMVAVLDVSVDMHEGARGAGDHLQVTVYKVPSDGSYSIGSYVDGDDVDPNSAFDQDPHNNAMVLGSTDVENGADVPSLLRSSVEFGTDSAALDATASGTLDRFAIDFQDANLDLSNPVQLTGHTSTSGSAAHNEVLAQQRVDAVYAYLGTKGFTNMADRVSTTSMGETGAGADASWQRVDLEVCGGRGQFVAAHEFGHAFGLMDEYSTNPGGGISGTGSAVGTITGHDAMAKAIGTPGSVAENNDNLMSLGTVVRPQHFATFGWALRTVSGVNEWAVH